MNALKAKLRDRRGMTLTEVLTAVLILALVASGMAVGVSASLRIYRQSVTLSDAQTLSSTLSTALMDELRYARAPSGDANAVFTSSTFGQDVSVSASDGYITVGGRELIGRGAYAGLTADARVSYTGGLFNVTVEIFSTGAAPVREVNFSVRPLNG